MMLEFVALTLAGMHFGTPLVYYLYLRTRYLNKPWGIKVDENYKPKVTIIVPTYREAKFIWDRLDNIYAQNYPRNLMEVVVVDSASDDGTVGLVREWASKHRDISLRLVEEPERRGMVPALNFVLQHCQIDGEIVVFTDVDAVWDSDALTKIMRYFADPNVGAVTASITPTTSSSDFLEGAYREYYNLLRVAESKVHSTPIHNGALVAFRTSLLHKMGGLPSYTGNNDSTPASIVAFMGYRAIQVDDVMVKEPVRGGQFYRKVRRAQHLLLSFLKTKRYVKKLGVYRHIEPFEKIWKMEWWLHVVNPWFLTASAILLVMSTLYASFTAITFLGIGIMLLVLKAYRTWVLQQLYLVIAAVRNLWTREIAWSK
jgi:cellulose synthase/poly-beta-1,6-N-acetylglucosamine synthase-like glycosyltransferase